MIFFHLNLPNLLSLSIHCPAQLKSKTLDSNKHYLLDIQFPLHSLHQRKKTLCSKTYTLLIPLIKMLILILYIFLLRLLLCFLNRDLNLILLKVKMGRLFRLCALLPRLMKWWIRILMCLCNLCPKLIWWGWFLFYRIGKVCFCVKCCFLPCIKFYLIDNKEAFENKSMK